jgi:hypothetical protein
MMQEKGRTRLHHLYFISEMPNEKAKKGKSNGRQTTILNYHQPLPEGKHLCFYKINI